MNNLQVKNGTANIQEHQDNLQKKSLWEFTLNSLLLVLTLLNIRFYAITAILDECNQNLEIGKLLSFELIKSLMHYCQPEN